MPELLLGRSGGWSTLIVFRSFIPRRWVPHSALVFTECVFHNVGYADFLYTPFWDKPRSTGVEHQTPRTNGVPHLRAALLNKDVNTGDT